MYCKRYCVRTNFVHVELAARHTVKDGSTPPVTFAPSARHAPPVPIEKSSTTEGQTTHRNAFTTAQPNKAYGTMFLRGIVARRAESVSTVPSALMRYFAALPLLTALAFYACSAHALAIVAPAASPTSSTVVRVALAIRNLVAIDEVKESWQVTGLLIAKWSDPSLRYRPSGRGQFHRNLPDSTWKPSLEFTNEDKPTDFRLVDFYVEPDGTVVYTQSFNATLSTDLDLRRFPFDSQRLPLVVQTRGEDLDRTILEADPQDCAVPKRGFVGLSQWNIGSLKTHVGTIEGSASRSTNVEFTLNVRRSPKPYILKFVVPLLLLVIISWVTFWLSHEEFKTKDQLTSAVSTLLIIVAFNITATSFLPRTDYITYIDALLFTCFVFVVISIATIVGIHLVEINHTQERALKARRIAGIVLPVAFLIAQAVLFFQFQIAG